ncbi:MAG: hypothetical protein JNL96_20100 [Planctomycetaceae bacterium]|nr:hypothetical protein [Planctomycetaceae bacterium]
MSADRDHLGGIIHTYQRYDPAKFPSPTQPPADVVSPAFEHMLAYGSLRELTDEELARAIHLDPSQIAGLGPSLDFLKQLLEERKQKILETYETDKVRQEVGEVYRQAAERLTPPGELRDAYKRAVREEQLRELERLWYKAGGERSRFAAHLMKVIERLSEKYQVDELAAKYAFTGQKRLDLDQALAIKEELETIDRLLKQLEEAAKTAQIAIIDVEELQQFVDPEQMENLNQLQKQVEDLVRQLAEQQGMEKTKRGYQLTPKAYRIFQSKLLEQIFSQLQASRTGRHQGPIVGEGAVELPSVKPYEFGDSVANMDIVGTFTNALIRSAGARPLRLKNDDIEIHRTRNSPKCATVVVMDMSGSMGRSGLYVHVKRMALAMDGLIRREYPGDFLQFVEMYTFAKPRAASEIAVLMPKPVTIYDPWVRLRCDMSDPNVLESRVPPHFTNIQHGLQTARRYLANQDTPNKQIILITDGLPTTHFEAEMLYLLYPPDPRTEEATMREGALCKREGITLNLFLLQSWSQSSEDIQFSHKLAEQTGGRVFFTAGKDLDRFVVWDYVNRRRSIIS